MNQTAHRSFSVGPGVSKTSDEYLVRAAQAGDLLAFAELRSRYVSRMQRLLYRITRNTDDADDALQECFLNVFIKLNRFENRSTFSTWLTAVAINSGLAVLRKRRQQKEISIDGGDDGETVRNRWEMTDCAEDPETLIERLEREAQLKQAILRLPPIYRAVVELLEKQEYSVKEISECLGISLPAAKSRLLRARRVLRKSLRRMQVT